MEAMSCELSAALDKGHKVGRSKIIQLRSGAKLKKEALKAAGISKDRASRYERFNLLQLKRPTLRGALPLRP
jgi:hypothetical protein